MMKLPSIETIVLVGSFFDPVTAVIKAILGAIARFFSSLFSAEVHIADNLKTIVSDFNETKANVKTLVEKIKEFKFEPNWKNRVINVPIAIAQIKETFEMVSNDFRERMETIFEPFHELSLIFRSEQEQAGSPNEAVSGISKTAVKIDEIATMVEQVARAMDTVKDFSELSNDIIDKLKGLDDLFLSQGSSRTIVEVRYRKRNG